MSERYDLAIIGTGPAGLSAALNAKIRNKKFILFGSRKLSGKLDAAHKIDNYLGFPGMRGDDLKKAFEEHLKSMEIEITEKKVTNIFQMGESYSLLADNEIYEAISIVLATGVQTGKGFLGEDTYLGKGVSYCATCDGTLYRGKTVVVIAYSSEEEEEAEYLAGLAAKVYYIPMYKGIKKLDESIQIIVDKPVEIKGDQVVTQLVLKETVLDTDGIFILRDTILPTTLVPGIETEENHVKVDRSMKTSLEGCYAAGDIVGKPYQYSKAAGEGNIASLSAIQYVDSLRRNAKIEVS